MSPTTGEQLVIEMNPRVSRSSALASKATGFPIARIGTKVAVGYRLDELPNDITKTTPASFEPVLDYVVVKIPRFAFEKFPTADPTLTTQMKSVGEVMAIGRTFKEALQKGFRGLEADRIGWMTAANPVDDRLDDGDIETVRAALRRPDARADLPGAPCARGRHRHRRDQRAQRHRSVVHRPAAGPARRRGGVEAPRSGRDDDARRARPRCGG